MPAVWKLALPLGVIVADGAATVANNTDAQIITAAITTIGVLGAAGLTAVYRHRSEREGDGYERPSAGEVARLRRERDEARAERDEAREMNERLLNRYLDDHNREQPPHD